LVESGGNLGYGGGMNAGLQLIGHCDAVLMLNPDLRLAPDAITRLLEAINESTRGAPLPRRAGNVGCGNYGVQSLVSLIR
jgi:GT2 family glycosyltransferase